MYALVGYNRAQFPGEEDRDEIVALFSTRELANKYLRSVMLKHPHRDSSFAYNSLLRGYRDAYIEEYEPPHEYFVDPTLPPKRKSRKK